MVKKARPKQLKSAPAAGWAPSGGSWIWVSQRDWGNLITTVTRIDRNVTALLPLVQTIQKVEKDMSAIDDAVANLTTQVTANTSAEQGAVQLIQQLAGLISTNASDPSAVNALADKLKASADALGAAITANTPAATT